MREKQSYKRVKETKNEWKIKVTVDLLLSLLVAA
ncbi:unnamed protein product [Spirodela intermedia]|uniref:Uncharacterized protein n=2 Tax=Spirodela intermedia TaxID=51605 RepID=A0A7I8JGZ7_SPIIN|nr:unnamed protein product [Spirodela intermedia]CAA6669414.1 unnamed protein product [Spirodela intermedia]CAA7406368.1 unnamed protein product [Spirodela intermedia]